MTVLKSQVKPNSEEFQANREINQRGVALLQERLELVRQGGGEAALKRHQERGKLPVRERIERLIDAGTPFLETSPLAAWDMYDVRR